MEYGTIRSRFWTHGTGKALRNDPEARLLCLYLMSCPTGDLTGIYYIPIATMAHELGSSMQGASEALRRVIDAGFCDYDWDEELVFVFRLCAEQVGDELKSGDKRVRGIQNALAKHKNHRFVAQFLEMYGPVYGLQAQAPNKPHASPLEAPPKPKAKAKTEAKTEGDACTRVATPPDPRSLEARLTFGIADVERIFSEERVAVGGKAFSRGKSDYQRAEDVVEHLVTHYPETCAEVCRLSARNFMALDKHRVEGFPFPWWAADVGRWLSVDPNESRPRSGKPEQAVPVRKVLNPA